MANGTHQIGWLVPDSCGRADGVGSRFFSVLNAGGDPQWVSANENGLRAVVIPQGQRVEVQLPRWDGVTFTGYQDVHGDVRPLPTGSTLDGNSGVFMWELAPGFLGPFDLVFVRSNGGDAVRVRVVVGAGR